MLHLHFDCFSGAAGDMILGALLDAGCPLEALQNVVARLKLPGVSLSAEIVRKQGLAATQALVAVGPEAKTKHRHLPHIEKIIDAADLKPVVAKRAKAVFHRLAVAEAAAHGTTIEKVHFHEVGAADAIVDIVCACAALDELGVERVSCSPVPTGHGTVRCEHGLMPVPAPATANLLKNIPLAACDEPHELTTPTGAAILTEFAERFGPPPAMRVRHIGYGAGQRDLNARPNVLRVMIGEAESSQPDETDVVAVLEANIDDADGQSLAHASTSLLEAGALDVYIVPIIMKKGRPAQMLGVLCRPADVQTMETILFRETTTFGVRRHDTRRTKLSPSHATVDTPFGPIRVKVGRRGDQIVQAWPEYDDCAQAARSAGVPLREVQSRALSAWRDGEKQR